MTFTKKTEADFLGQSDIFVKIFDLVKEAQAPNPWDFGNRILYDLCRNYPTHADTSAVVAKIWLIGRSYAAAIERGRVVDDLNDDFYVNIVAPRIMDSDIDQWIHDAKKEALSADSLILSVDFHWETTQLFQEISSKYKRSLASKYLHFHVPEFFFIYDSRALNGLRKFSKITGRVTNTQRRGDNDYRKFSEKCIILRDWINTKYNILLTPRELDNLLLSADKTIEK